MHDYGRSAIVGALVVGFLTASTPLSAAQSDPSVDAEVRAQLSAAGRARVLVELRVEPTAETDRRETSIARVQDSVLARLPASHSALVRRYTSVPLLALEIDTMALNALETMTGLVAAVKADRPRGTQ